jgi:nicotinate-nucleotide adenylyltransferase
MGHVAAARAVVQRLGLDRLLLVTANDPWQKSVRRAVSPAEDRWALTQALAVDTPGSEASRMEIDRGGPSYSVDTVEAVLAAERASGRDPEVYLVVGADLVPELESWHRHQDLKRLVTLAVVSRPGDVVRTAPPGWRAEWVEGPEVDISSSEVRDLLAAGASVEGLVPENVVRCIRRRGMYAGP